MWEMLGARGGAAIARSSLFAALSLAAAALGCGGGSGGAGGGSEGVSLRASIAAADLDDGGGSSGGPVAAAAGASGAPRLLTAQAASGLPGRRVRARLALRDGKGKPVKVDLAHASLTVLESDCAIKLRTVVAEARGGYPMPPLEPFPGKSSATLSGLSVALRSKEHPSGQRDVEGISLRSGARYRYTIAPDGTLARAHPRNPPGAPDLALVGKELVRIGVGAPGEPVATAPLEVALLGPVSYDGPAATTFERYTEAPASGYAPARALAPGSAYALRLADGTYAKVHVADLRASGNGKHVRALLDYVYQCDGSRDLAPNFWPVDPSTIEIGEPAPPPLAAGLVADNSGSESGFLDPLKQGLSDFAGRLDLARDGASLVRVSTEARVRAPFGRDRAALDAAIGGLFIANGWTALYDGIRLGAETLEDAFLDAAEAGAPAPFPALVVFTDGKDNNSADEQDTAYAGDGIDTTFDDCAALEAGGVPVPIYAIALGHADREALDALAEATGGASYDIDEPNAIAEAYATIRDSIGASTALSFETGFDERAPFARRTALLILRVRALKKDWFITAWVRIGDRARGSTCDLSSGRRVRVGHRPRAAARVPGTDLLLVANAGEATLSLVDLARAEEIDWDLDPNTRSRGAPLGITRPAVGRGPAAVAVTPDGASAVVANERDGTVSIVDLAAQVEAARVAVGRGPAAVAIAPAGDRAYVACRRDDAVFVVDLGTLDAARFPVGDDPAALALHGGTLFVVEANLSAAGGPGALVARDAATLAEIGRIEVGRAPTSVALSPGGTRAYVTNRRSGTIAVVDISDPARMALRRTLAAGKNPAGAAVWADAQGRSFVSCALAGADRLATFRRADLDERWERAAAAQSPAQVVPWPEGGRLVSVDQGAGTLTLSPLPAKLP